MRLDDYRCTDCTHVFEALLATDEAPHCPTCGSEHAERQLAGFAIGGASTREGACTSGCATPSFGGCANGMCGL